MNLGSPKIYNGILHASILTLTVALVWFAFVYYPKTLNQITSGSILPSRSIYQPVSAFSKNFPIETSAYRLVYEDASQSYYAFVEGQNLEEYVFNQDNAKLALKTALSAENLCQFNVFYVSVKRLKIPPRFKGDFDC